MKTVLCPTCQAGLVLSEVTSVERLRCSKCGALFGVGAGGQEPTRWSRLALGSLVVGILSPLGSVLASGLAIFLGWRALKRIKQEPQLKGKRVAITGMGIAVLTLLVCSPCYLGIFAISASIQRNESPEIIIAATDSIVEFDLPAGMGPQEYRSVLGLVEVVYSGKDVAASIAFRRVPRQLQQSIEIQRPQVARQHGGTLLNSEDWAQDPFPIVKQTCQLEENGVIVRRYYTLHENDGELTVINVTVREVADPDEGIAPLTDEQVKSFFDSIKLIYK